MADEASINVSSNSNFHSLRPEEAQRHFSDGRSAEEQMDRWTAIDAYRRAFDAAPDDPEICFRLAYNLDLVGEEDEAIQLYERCTNTDRPQLNALINLAVMYEDEGDYAQAEKCLRQVLDTNPNHRRARLYIKDVQASRLMFYDEDAETIRTKQSSLLETPVTDFELSVRARNCLKKMNIRSLGDLLRTTEAELLGYKNFGETSLSEIKAMLAQRGLRLGQALEQQQNAARNDAYGELEVAANTEEFKRPVAELDLSVRARRALSLLNINTIGDLISHTEAELLGIKNFGSTSLTEIKEKLAERGLSLRKLEG